MVVHLTPSPRLLFSLPDTEIIKWWCDYDDGIPNACCVSVMQWWYWNDSCIHNSIFALNDCRVACHCQRSDRIERALAGVERHLRHRSSECEMQNLHVIPECILNCLLFESMSLGVSLPLECLKPLVDASELSSLNPNRNANPKAPRRRLKQMPKWELPRFNELTLVHYTKEDISHSQQNINIWMKAFPLIHSWT